LGRVAYANEDFYHTLMWMQEALDHLDEEINNTSINKIDILDHLAYATLKVSDRVDCYQTKPFLFLARKY
jgi:prolyl 4-hydroxylase